MTRPGTDELDAADAAIAAKQAIESKPDKAKITFIPHDGVQVVLRGQPREIAKIFVGLVAMAIACVIVGIILNRLDWGKDFDSTLFNRPMLTFGVIALVATASAICLLLLQVVAGPDRDVIIEIHPGRLILDRYIAGDHVVREYFDRDICGIAIQSGAITIATSKEEFSIGMYISADIQFAAVAVIAQVLWQDSAYLVRNLRMSKLTGEQLKLYACDRRLLEPSTEQE